MTLYKPGTENDMPTEQEMSAVGQLIEEMARAGTLITTDGLQPSSKGARVRIDSNGKFTQGCSEAAWKDCRKGVATTFRPLHESVKVV